MKKKPEIPGLPKDIGYVDSQFNTDLEILTFDYEYPYFSNKVVLIKAHQSVPHGLIFNFRCIKFL